MFKALIMYFVMITSVFGAVVRAGGGGGGGTWTSSGNDIYSSNSGNVGIGTVNPSQKLDVNGGIRSNSSGISYFMSNMGIGTNIPFMNLAVLGNVGIGTISNGSFLNTQPSSGGMNIEGNVGIGTFTPSSLLEVGARKFNVFSGGNIGIGSIVPGSLVDVAGNFRITTGGFLVSQQVTAPTVATNDCGTTAQGTVTANSSDLLGTLTVGTLAVTSCSMTFNKTHNTAPICFCQDDTNVLAVRCTTTTTKLTVTSVSSMSSDAVAYWCPTNIP